MAVLKAGIRFIEMKRVLLVEDDNAISMGLSYSLKQEGYSIEVCSTAASAKDAVSRTDYDLAILDLTLPDGSGYDVCRFIREKGNTRVIFLTVCEDEVNVVMGLDMGADDYITKPFRLGEFLSRVRTVLRRAENENRPGDEIHFGDIVIDTKRAKVTKDGAEIFLSALEYRLLLTLATNKGRVLTRDLLMEGIWDISGNYVNDNTITVYIKRLREKIGDDPHNPT
jgi:DNA-binding response OmpR family regulator